MTQRSCAGWLKSFPSFEPLCDGGTHFRGRAHRRDASRFKRLEFRCRRALAAGHNRSGMAHPLAGRRGNAGDVRDDGFAHMLAYEGGGGLFVASADLAHHHNALGLCISLEQSQDIDEVHAAHRISAYTHTGALTQSVVGRLEYCLIGEGTRPGNNAYPPLLVNESRHDADLAFLGPDDAGAIRADEPGL